MPVRDKLVHLFPIVYNYSIGSDHFQPKAYPAVCGGSLLRMQGRGSGAETHGPPVLSSQITQKRRNPGALERNRNTLRRISLLFLFLQ